MSYKRIHIIGGPGSGKSYLGRKLTRHFNLPQLELDDIFWDNTAASYNTKRPEAERDQLLHNFIIQPAWVVEGVYYKWLAESFSQADVIIVLNAPLWRTTWRVIVRFIKRKLGLEKNPAGTLVSQYNLVVWSFDYAKTKIPAVLEMTEPFKAKRHVFTNADEAFDFLTK